MPLHKGNRRGRCPARHCGRTPPTVYHGHSCAAEMAARARTNFRPDWARGPEKNIRTWGQLGLKGEWADKPIHVYGFNLRYNTATDFADKVLKASDKWNENIHAYAHIVQPDGKRYIQA